MAHPMMWVKLTLPPVLPARNRLTILRFSSRSFAGTNRKDVAVGISRDRSMFWAISAPTPFSNVGVGRHLVWLCSGLAVSRSRRCRRSRGRVGHGLRSRRRLWSRGRCLPVGVGELRLEVLEELLPALGDRIGIVSVLPVDLVDQPHVRPEGGGVDFLVLAHLLVAWSGLASPHNLIHLHLGTHQGNHARLTCAPAPPGERPRSPPVRPRGASRASIRALRPPTRCPGRFGAAPPGAEGPVPVRPRTP